MIIENWDSRIQALVRSCGTQKIIVIFKIFGLLLTFYNSAELRSISSLTDIATGNLIFSIFLPYFNAKLELT